MYTIQPPHETQKSRPQEAAKGSDTPALGLHSSTGNNGGTGTPLENNEPEHGPTDRQNGRGGCEPLDANALKAKARGIIQRTRNAGKLKREPCRVCGHPLARAHHEDYSKPLDVIWLCVSHHRARHKELGWGTPGPKKPKGTIPVVKPRKSGRGRPALPKDQRLVVLSGRVRQETYKRVNALARAKGISIGRAIDDLFTPDNETINTPTA